MTQQRYIDEIAGGITRDSKELAPLKRKPKVSFSQFLMERPPQDLGMSGRVTSPDLFRTPLNVQPFRTPLPPEGRKYPEQWAIEPDSFQPDISATGQSALKQLEVSARGLRVGTILKYTEEEVRNTPKDLVDEYRETWNNLKKYGYTQATFDTFLRHERSEKYMIATGVPANLVHDVSERIYPVKSSLSQEQKPMLPQGTIAPLDRPRPDLGMSEATTDMGLARRPQIDIPPSYQGITERGTPYRTPGEMLDYKQTPMVGKKEAKAQYDQSVADISNRYRKPNSWDFKDTSEVARQKYSQEMKQAWDKYQAEQPGFKESVAGRAFYPKPLTPEEAAKPVGEQPTLTWLNRVKELSDTPGELIPFVGSGMEMTYLAELLSTAQSLNTGKDVNQESLLALKQFVDHAQRDKTWGYKVLDVIANMIPWGLEFVLTGGIYSAGEKATIKASTEALKRITTKSGAKILERNLVKYGIKVAGVVGGGTLRTLPIAGAKIPAATLEKQLYRTLTGDEEAVWKSVIKSAGEQWVETVSESTGGLFTPLATPIKGQLVKLGIFKSLLKANPAKDASDIRAFVGKLGYNGVIEEMLEERVSDVGHGILAELGLGDQKFSIPSLEQLSIELVAFSIPGVAVKLAESINIPFGEIATEERGSVSFGGKPDVPKGPLPAVSGVGEGGRLRPFGSDVDEIAAVANKTKPIAVLLNPYQSIPKGITEHIFADSHSGEILYIYHPKGKTDVVSKYKELFDRTPMDKRNTPQWHTEQGRLLGYSKADIKAFIESHRPSGNFNPKTGEPLLQPAVSGVAPEVITEEDYLASKGAGFMEGAEPAIHKNIPEGRGRQQGVARVQADMAANNARREALRKEYQAKVKSGEIRPPTRNERLVVTARGNPDNQSVQSARRLLEKQGIDWEVTRVPSVQGVQPSSEMAGVVTPQPRPQPTEPIISPTEGEMGRIPPTQPPTQPPATEAGGINDPPPSITPGVSAKNAIGLREIEPGLTRHETFRNYFRGQFSRVYSKVGWHELVLEDALANPAMTERARLDPIIESLANDLGDQSQFKVNKEFELDKQGRIPSLAEVIPEIGAPTIQDVAARLPLYQGYLTGNQVDILTTIRDALKPYRDLMAEVGVEVGSRGDVIDGGFYIPRSSATLEDADLPYKVSGGGRGGMKKGFEKPAIFDSQAEGISAGYKYPSLREALINYVSGAGHRATDAHVVNYFKALTDDMGKLLGETPKMRMLRQNPGVSQVVDGIKSNLVKLKSNVGALTQRQIDVIDLWANDPDFAETSEVIISLQEGLATMKGGRPPQTLKELKTLLKSNIDALKALKPSYDKAMRQAQTTPIDQGVITLPGLQGRTFPLEQANAVNIILKNEGSLTGKGAEVGRVVRAFNGLWAMTHATGDLSASAIQGLLMVFNNPVAWSKAFVLQVKSLFNENVAGAFLADADAAATKAGRLTNAQWAQYGSHYNGAEGFLETIGVSSKISNIPVIRESNRAFGTFGDAARNLWRDGQLQSEMNKGRTLEEVEASGDLERIAFGANAMTGWARKGAGGSIGETLLFAPRWLQARLDVVGRAVAGMRPNAPVDQAMARNAFLKMIVFGTLLTVAINAALGQDTDFRPVVDGKRNGKFMRIKFGSAYYSLFGSWDSLLGMIINIGTGLPLNVLRSMGSGLVATSFDLITGKDYNYNQVGSKPFDPLKLMGWIARSSVPFAAGGMIEAGGQMIQNEVIPGVVNFGANILGVKSYVDKAELLAGNDISAALDNLGKEDGEARQADLDKAETPNDITKVMENDYTYNTQYLGTVIQGATKNMDADAIAKSKLPPIVKAYWDAQEGLERYDDLPSVQSIREQFRKANPQIDADLIIWRGYTRFWGSEGIVDSFIRTHRIPRTALDIYRKERAQPQGIPSTPPPTSGRRKLKVSFSEYSK